MSAELTGSANRSLDKPAEQAGHQQAVVAVLVIDDTKNEPEQRAVRQPAWGRGTRHVCYLKRKQPTAATNPVG